MTHAINSQNSEKKKSTSPQEKALAASEIRYRCLFESTKDGILILDAETGMIVDVNPFLMELLGYSKESFIEKSIWKIGFLKDIINNKNKFLELQRNKYVRYEDLPLETADGRIINVEFVSNVYLANDQKVIQCNIRDITERKETEAGLEKTRLKLAEIKKKADEESIFIENIINAVREPLLVLDEKLRVIKASRSFYNIFKANPKNTIGKLIYDFGNRQWDIPKLRELLEKILPEKTSFDNYEVEHDFSTIGTRIMLLNARQIKRGLGKEKIILLAFEDITERKLEERSLSEKIHMNIKYLNILLNHAHSPIITWDSSLFIKRFNPEFEKLSGYNKYELQDKKIEMLFPKNEVASTLELIKRNIGDKNPEVIEINILTKNKEIRTVLWNSANISNEEGKKTVTTIAQDITSRKRSEEALNNSEIRYRRLFESAKDGILILNAETGMIIDVNPFLIELLGYTKNNFIQKSIWEIGAFKDIYENKEKFLELQQKEYVRYDDLPLVTSDGYNIHVEFVSNVYLEDDQKVIQCNIRDITERVLSEKTIIDAYKMLRTLIDNLPDFIYIKDAECRKVMANIADINNIGYQNEEEILGKTDVELFPGVIGQRGYADDQKVINSGKAIINRLEDFLNSKGKRRWISTTKIPLRNNEGEITGLVGIGHDITESKKIEKELTKAKEKAEESDRLKSAFLANMSHEIRTPMNGILGFTQLLKTPELTGKKQQEFIGIIEKSGARMLNIINDIINISKIESGQVETTVSYININEQVEDIYNFFKPEVEQKKLHFLFTTPLPANVAVIKTDMEKVYAVLTNLVKNALKFTQKGSIELGCEKKGEFLEFFVKDTGAGISREQENFIFKRFRQGSESLTRGYEGAGLGLAISKAYVEMLGGKIWIESKVGQGSAFRFTIPYLNGIEEKEQPPVITEDEIHQSEKLKILAVEDDELSRELLNILFKPLASDFFQAINGLEAIEICRKNPDLDLVLMDIQLPDIDGYEATKIIREFNTKVIIIAQTAFALSGDREKALKAGCNDHISKPIKMKALTKMIESHI